MSGILTPGYLRWDGTKYVLDHDVEIVGPAGSQGPAGPTGPAGPPGPFGTASGDLLGTYPGPISVVGLTGIFGTVSYGSAITNPTITQVGTASTTGQAMTFKAQNAAVFGGNVVLQSGTGTTAGVVQFLTGNTLAAFIDANTTFRIGPSAASTVTGPNGISPLAGTDYIFGNNSAGSMLAELFSNSSSQRAGYFSYNAAAGGAAVSGISIQAPGTTYTVGAYQGQGVIEQAGTATSSIVLSKVLGDGTSRAITGRIFQSGAWGIGDTGASSSGNQVGLTGPLLNFGRTSGVLTSASFQTTIFNSDGGSPFGILNLQGHVGVNLISQTTSVASTTTTKFITSVGRRVKVRNTTTSPDTMTAADEVVAIGTIAAPFTINLPASPTLGDTYMIKDANGSAALFNITISGNGVNIDGGFSSIPVMINFTQATFTYNGTTWISSLTTNVTPTAGFSSVVNVASGGSTTVTGFDALILCDPTTNPCTVTMPASPVVNMRVTIKDATATSNIHAIVVQGNGKTLENPISPGTYSGTVNITSASLSATWTYDPIRVRFTMV